MPSLHLILSTTTALNSAFLLHSYSPPPLQNPNTQKTQTPLLQWNHKPKLFGSTPYIAVITSNKGSMGKTTTTASFGLSLACLGFSIVVIVANIGLRNLDLLLDLDNHVNYTLIETQRVSSLSGQLRLSAKKPKDALNAKSHVKHDVT
ncbi:putative septum site-determining protein minD, chloroplastic [Glycine soja]